MVEGCTSSVIASLPTTPTSSCAMSNFPYSIVYSISIRTRRTCKPLLLGWLVPLPFGDSLSTFVQQRWSACIFARVITLDTLSKETKVSQSTHCNFIHVYYTWYLLQYCNVFIFQRTPCTESNRKHCSLVPDRIYYNTVQYSTNK